MVNKKKVLCWSDAPVAGTGFGVVSKYVIGALEATGKYEIDQLAINFHGDFVDKERVPWQMQPAKLLDPADPHGMKMFFRTMLKKDYDIVWILNDLFVTHQVTNAVEKIRERAITRGIDPPIFIYYYPVDCHVKAEGVGMLDTADICVCYTKHGREETLLTRPNIESKLVEIPHGVDSTAFRPLNKDDITLTKRQFFKIGPDTTVVVCVNRNSTRKQLPYTILAFKKFKELVPNSIMYMHTMMQDQGSDLTHVLLNLGLSSKTDVIFPTKYSPAHPASVETMNLLYNCGDMFLTTHLGEGWGLTITEAMAAGIPVIAPNNTCMPQQLGENSERGYMYECRDELWIDSSGFRPKGLIPDIAQQMYNAHKDNKEFAVNPKAIAARRFAEEHDWNIITQKWITLFENLEFGRTTEVTPVVEEI